MNKNEISQETRNAMIEIIRKFILTDYEKEDKPETFYDEYTHGMEALKEATADQLWTLCRMVQFDRQFRITYAPCGCPGVIGLKSYNMFIGVEPDGYAHS